MCGLNFAKYLKSFTSHPQYMNMSMYIIIMKMLLKVNMCDEDNKQPRMSKQFELSLKTRIIFKFIEGLIA